MSKAVREIITDPANKIIISTISFWEISLKSLLGKLQISGFSPEDLPAACLQIGFDIEELNAKDSSSYHKLKANHHKDAFDRMLIWQAIRNDYIFITADANIKKYSSEGLQIFS